MNVLTRVRWFSIGLPSQIVTLSNNQTVQKQHLIVYHRLKSKVYMWLNIIQFGEYSLLVCVRRKGSSAKFMAKKSLNLIFDANVSSQERNLMGKVLTFSML